MKNGRYKVAYVTTSPSWHQPELYERISAHPQIDLMVYFCSEESLNGKVLAEAFEVHDKDWGLDLLHGYNHSFLRNYSPIKPKFGKTRLFSYLNFGVWNRIKKGCYDAVVLTLWNDVIAWITALACKVHGTPLFLLGDSTILTEQTRPRWLRRSKELLLGHLLFPLCSGFFFLNEPNRQFFLHYGVPEDRLFFYPHSIDFQMYEALRADLQERKKDMREEMGISSDSIVVIYVGRLSPEKCPMDLVEAFKKVKAANKVLFFLGDGKLRATLEDVVQREHLQNVHVLGFAPRSEVPKYYAISDLLVLPSRFEPHGLVVNEAMCFGLPVIVSDKVGASVDLVDHGKNGYVYPCGDTNKLAHYIDELADEEKRRRFGERSLEIVKEWDHEKAVTGLLAALDKLYEEDREWNS